MLPFRKQTQIPRLKSASEVYKFRLGKNGKLNWRLAKVLAAADQILQIRQRLRCNFGGSKNLVDLDIRRRLGSLVRISVHLQIHTSIFTRHNMEQFTWRQYRWLGHVQRMSSDRIAKTRGQSNLTKSASRGAHSPVRGHPRGSKVVPLNSWGRVSY